MNNSTDGTPKQVSPYCIGADALGVSEAHTRCGANGPQYLPNGPAGTAPVLPSTPCGCACHTTGRRA